MDKVRFISIQFKIWEDHVYKLQKIKQQKALNLDHIKVDMGVSNSQLDNSNIQLSGREGHNSKINDTPNLLNKSIS